MTQIKGINDISHVYTCTKGKNASLIAQVAKLYAPAGACIADVTWGKGAFWKGMDTSHYTLLPTDIATGVDFRHLPYDDGSLDIVVLDPPYAHNPGAMLVDATYNNGATTRGMYHVDIQRLYTDGMREARRVLKVGGLLWVKCQDEIESGKQCYSHIELYLAAVQLGYYAKDLFVLMQDSPATVQVKRQLHARKNHSYLWIFRKEQYV